MTGSIVHLVLGHPTAGTVRWANERHALGGRIVVVHGDPTVGPLSDAFAADEGWTELEELLRRETREVVVWHGATAAEQIFLLTAARRLRDHPGPVSVADVTSIGGWSAAPLVPPEEVGRVIAGRSPMTAADREGMARTLADIEAHGGLLRGMRDGRVVTLPREHYDAAVMSHATYEWRPAADVAGDVMGGCAPDNPLSDDFVGSRLRVLIDAGRLEATGDRSALRTYRVRRAPPGSPGPEAEG